MELYTRVLPLLLCLLCHYLLCHARHPPNPQRQPVPKTASLYCLCLQCQPVVPAVPAH